MCHEQNRGKTENRQNHIIFAKRFIECVKFSYYGCAGRWKGRVLKRTQNSGIIVELKARELREKSYFIKKGFHTKQNTA